MAYLIGTAGHVDHGKTTLIAALTGIDADRLPEEKSRGMTIDLGFAFLELPGIGRVSIVDVPGHERFIKNMLAGASGVDVALLCVASDEGVMPQTREHFEILRLLESRALVVALTKCDATDIETQNIAELDVRQLLENTKYEQTPIIRVSAHTGIGLEEMKTVLTETIKSLGARSVASDWFLPIDRVFTIAGHGTVVTGTLAAGKASVGSEGVLMPGSEKVRIRSIQTHGVAAEHAEAGQRTALNVAGVRKEVLHRGQAVGSPGALVETRCVNVRLAPVAELRHGQRIRAHIGSGEFIAKLFLFDEAKDIAQIRFETGVACAQGQRMVLRRYSPPTVLAGAEIITPNAKPRRKNDKGITEVATVSAGSPQQRILAELERRPLGIETGEICEALGQTPQALGGAFEDVKALGQGIGFGGMWIHAKHYAGLAERVREALMRLHKQSPQATAISRVAVLKESGIGWHPKAFDRLAAQLGEDKSIDVHGADIKHPDFTITLNDKQSTLLERTIEVMKKGGAVAPAIEDIAREIGAPKQAAEEMIRLGLATGRLVKVEEGLFYPVETIEDLREMLKKLGPRFTVAQFRDLTGSSRKFALPILQHFDEIKFTKRVGDERLIIGD